MSDGTITTTVSSIGSTHSKNLSEETGSRNSHEHITVKTPAKANGAPKKHLIENKPKPTPDSSLPL
ncbi:hypothetical protein ACFQJ8_13830 [Halocatena marina]|uniref:hypothetical protein n=1 Tax=Halocatena marina TaxID=2934937 RepID=UPI003611ED82